MSIESALYKLTYQISPIILTGGLAKDMPYQMLPFIALTEPTSIGLGLLTGADVFNVDNFYANFSVMSGGTLHSNQIGNYPFANQKVAANAIIANPLNISLKMQCHPHIKGAMVSRLMTALALKTALDNHNYAGGTYTVLTPAFIYTNCVMMDFKDISDGDPKRPQVTWQIDFQQPLITLDDAAIAYSGMMERIAGGLPMVNPSLWSGVDTVVAGAKSAATVVIGKLGL